MPRYFFDTSDGERQTRDEIGIELRSLVDMAAAARDLLHDLGHAELLAGVDRLFTATVRDERGVTVYRGSANVRIEINKGVT